MITLQDYDTSDLADFADTILKGCDTNKDGKVSRKVNITHNRYGQIIYLSLFQELTMILMTLANQ